MIIWLIFLLLLPLIGKIANIYAEVKLPSNKIISQQINIFFHFFSVSVLSPDNTSMINALYRHSLDGAVSLPAVL